jgi:hypothetical protein
LSDYIVITDYAAKDALLTGNPAKLVKGTEIKADLDAVAVAVATKYDSTDVGTSIQAYDAFLTSIATLGTAADKMIYTTAANTAAESAITAAGRAILDDATASDQLTTLGVSTFAKTVLDDTTAAAVRITLELEAPRADIASATTLNLDATTTHSLNVTGTTATTAITLADGATRILRANAAWPITHGASLICPGSASYTCAAGDLILAIGEPAGVVRLAIWKANGTAVVVAASSAAASKNYITNGSFAVNQVVTPTTTDNSYPIDEWRLLLGAANAATFVQDTADVPTGAGFAAKLIVGSGNNNKFGIWHPVENKDMLDLRGGVCSLRVPLKATAGLTDGTGKIRIGVMEWTGTADAISADPISAWGAEGTNPTLAAGWAFVNTPAAISVTTSWADYTVENVSIGASATNLAVMIWADDTTSTQTTDILRIGGYVTLTKGATAADAMVAAFPDELAACKRKFETSFPYGTAPAQNAGVNTGPWMYLAGRAGTTSQYGQIEFKVEKRVAPTAMTFYSPAAASGEVYDLIATASCSSTQVMTGGAATTKCVPIQCAGNASTLAGYALAVHWAAYARL